MMTVSCFVRPREVQYFGGQRAVVGEGEGSHRSPLGTIPPRARLGLPPPPPPGIRALVFRTAVFSQPLCPSRKETRMFDDTFDYVPIHEPWESLTAGDHG